MRFIAFLLIAKADFMSVCTFIFGKDAKVFRMGKYVSEITSLSSVCLQRFFETFLGNNILISKGIFKKLLQLFMQMGTNQ